MSKQLLISCITVLVVLVFASPVMAYDRGEEINVQIPYDLDSLKQATESDNQEAHNLWSLWKSAVTSQWLPQWSADENVYFMGNGLFRVSASGGMTELLRPEEDEIGGLTYQTWPKFSLSSMAPNSTELYFENNLNGQTFIEVYDVDTGNIEAITEGRNPEVSNSGTYLTYLEQTEYPTPWDMILRNLNTGTETILDTGQIHGQCFTPDESTVIYSKAVSDGNYQLFSIPISGGDPVQLTTYDGGVLGKMRSHPQMHPDGNLIVYTDANYDEEYQEERTFTHSNGSSMTTWHPSQLAVFNMATGQTMYLFEYDDDPEKTVGEQWGYFQSEYGVFSPDGTKICYCGIYSDELVLNDDEQKPPKELYIFDFATANYTGEPLAVAEAVPVAFPTVDNYPNPFNPSTTITFSLPEAGHATLAVYSVAGQKVRELVSGHLTAGAHDIVWDGCDDDGNMLSSGVYVTRLVADGIVGYDRMTLMR